MKILFLSHYFPPEVNAPASRAHEHCKVWVAAGHEVTLVTCAPNHPYGRVYDGFSNRRSDEVIDGVRVVRLKTFISANKGFLKRTLGFISYMLAVILAAPSLGKHDIVLSTSPQFFNGLAGYFVSRCKGLPWLLEIRDLWPDSILTVGAIRNKYLIGVLYWLEEFCYRKCDKLVVVTDSFRRHIVAKGIPETKISVIKNGVDFSTFNVGDNIADSEHAEVLSELDVPWLRNKFVVAYVGTHGMAHSLNSVLDAANKLKDHSHIHFLLVGDGSDKEALLKQRDKLGLMNVTMLDQKPKKVMPYIWSLTDLSLVHLKKDELFKTVIPSKIFEALAMEKPILLGVEGESADLIRDSGGGITMEPENAEQMAQIVLTLAKDPVQCQAMAAMGSNYVRKYFNRITLAENYLQLMLGMVRGSASHKPRYQDASPALLEAYRSNELK